MAGFHYGSGPATSPPLTPHGGVWGGKSSSFGRASSAESGLADRRRLGGIGDEAGAPLAEQLRALALLGWAWLELRTVDGVTIADLDEVAFADVARVVERAGMGVSCVASRIAGWSRPITGDPEDDLRELDVLAGRCRSLGTRFVRVMSYPNDGLPEPVWRLRALERMRRLAERAEHADLVLLHENCSGWAATSGSRMVEMLEVVDSPALRLLFDTGNGVEHGYDAYELLTQIAGWVEHVHVKDAAGDEGSPVYVLPGEGRCQLADCLRLLDGCAYGGVLSIEPHRLVRPHLGLTEAGSEGVEDFVEYGRRLEKLLESLASPVGEHSGGGQHR